MPSYAGAAWRRVGSGRERRLQHDPVARELAPARLRSDRKILGPLRSPAGASSLATGCKARLTDCSALPPSHKGFDYECLLANLSETLASADAMVNELAFDLEGSNRHVLLGIQQLIELSSLLANRVLDNINPR